MLICATVRHLAPQLFMLRTMCADSYGAQALLAASEGPHGAAALLVLAAVAAGVAERRDAVGGRDADGAAAAPAAEHAAAAAAALVPPGRPAAPFWRLAPLLQVRLGVCTLCCMVRVPRCTACCCQRSRGCTMLMLAWGPCRINASAAAASAGLSSCQDCFRVREQRQPCKDTGHMLMGYRAQCRTAKLMSGEHLEASFRVFLGFAKGKGNEHRWACD